MRTFQAVLVGAIAFVGAVACKRQMVEVSTTAYIVGPTNDIRPALASGETEVPQTAVDAAVLVATRMQDKRIKFCSGTLVAPAAGQTNYRVLTNHHCFAETGADGKATKALLLEACTFTTVYFGYLSGQAKDAEAVTCTAASLRTSFEGDLAVFTLSHNAAERYRPIALWDGEEAPEGRAAVIVHYPDIEAEAETPPEGGPRLPTAAVTVADCKVIGLFDVAEWSLDRTLPYSLRHSCDLIHGSSGSGLIDVATGKLLGVNWGGIKITYDSGVRTDNVATRASFARAFLEGSEASLVSATAEQKRTGRSVAQGSSQGSDANAQTKESAGKSMKKKACGVIEGAERNACVALLALFALPLIVAWRSRAVAKKSVT